MTSKTLSGPIPGLPHLNFPASEFRLREENGKRFIFDIVRKKYVNLNPEEWVRQHCIHYLVNFKACPVNRMGVEKSLELNGQRFRFDLIVYSRQAVPLLLVECKAPEVAISQSTVDQIVVYNMKLRVPVLLMTNGLQLLCCRIGFEPAQLTWLQTIPEYPELETYLFLQP